ncbi:MAG: hypothetical protein AB3N13_02885 [Arenibacterium sp.]
MTALRLLKGALAAAALTFTLAACEPGSGSVSVSGGVYYDSLLWNDYYYGYPRPPSRPGRPPGARPPVAKPPIARPPIHRPPVARPRPRL